MFGPGTHCRCASCTNLPADCQWGGGPYAGTLLLYAQVKPWNIEQQPLPENENVHSIIVIKDY